MTTYEDKLKEIENPDIRQKYDDFVKWVGKEYPQLELVIELNTPMYILGNTFILGMSAFDDDLAINPEPEMMIRYGDEIENAGYERTMSFFRIPWDEEINYDLIKMLVDINIEEKEGSCQFWRKAPA